MPPEGLGVAFRYVGPFAFARDPRRGMLRAHLNREQSDMSSNDPDHDHEGDVAGLDALLSGMLATDKGQSTQEPPKAPLLTPRRLIALSVVAVVVLATVFVLTRPPARVPVFMDCQADALVVYEDVENPTRYSSRELITSEPFRQTLETIKNTENGVAVFLVRGKPTRAYYLARFVAKQAGCPHMKIDIGKDDRIDKAMLDELSP